MLLHVLGHVDADHGVLIAEHGLGQGLAQLGLADAGGAQEQEGADGPLGVLQTHTAAADGLGHGGHGLVLAHHPLMQDLLQLQQPLAFVLRQAGDGDAGPAGHHLGDVVLGDGAAAHGHLLVPLVALNFHLLLIVLLDIPQLGGLLEVLGGDGLLLLPVQGGDLLLQILQIGGGGLGGHTHLAGGLVHQVDSLVRQETVVDIPAGQPHGGLQGPVGDGQVMVGLILVPQALQDLQRGLGRGLAHGDGLEPALQGGVLLNVLAVLVEGGGADDPDLAPGQSGLEDVGGVHRALGGACAHDGVQLVDEQDDVAGLLHLVDGVLDALLKLAPVLGTGHHAGQVQGQDPLVQQVLGHVGGHDALGQALGNGGFAHAGLTDQHGVVLGAAGQNLDDPGNLLFPADDRVQLAAAGGLGQIAGKLRQGAALLAVLPGGSGGAAAGGGCGAGRFVDLFHHGAVQLLGVDAHGAQHPDGHIVALTQQAHQQMLGTNVARAGAGRFGHGQLHGALGPGGQPLGGSRAGKAGAHAAMQHIADHIIGEACLLQDAVGNALLLTHQAQQQMLGAHIAMSHFLGSLLGQPQGFLRTGGEFIFHHSLHFLSVDRRNAYAWGRDRS